MSSVPSSTSSLSIVADTHAIVWYMDDPTMLSSLADSALTAAADDGVARIYLSSITLVELQYLTEKSRIKPSVLPQLLIELDRVDSFMKVVSVDRLVADALVYIPRTVVPDMPDRIIAATAFQLGLPLVTADTKIQACGTVTTIW